VAGYVAHRLQTAGGSPDRVRFSPEAIEGIYRVSGGVPRLINRLCDRALYQGHLRRAATIDREILEAAVPEAVRFAPAPIAVAAPIAVVEPAAAVAPVAAVPVALSVSSVPEPALAAIESPAATPAFISAPATWPQQYPDPVDEWLAFVDEGVKTTALAAGRAEFAPPALPRPDRLIPLHPPEATPPPVAERPRVKAAPRTHMERFTRRWARRLGVAALALVTFGVALVGAPSVLELSANAWSRSTELLAEPIAPELPAAPALHLAPAAVLPLFVETLPPAAAVPGAASDPSSTGLAAER
jgi:hypothetical protein